MSQELMTPSDNSIELAEYYFKQAQRAIPFNSKCCYCRSRRWFCKNVHDLELCKICFENWYKDTRMKESKANV